MPHHIPKMRMGKHIYVQAVCTLGDENKQNAHAQIFFITLKLHQ